MKMISRLRQWGLRAMILGATAFAPATHLTGCGDEETTTEQPAKSLESLITVETQQAMTDSSGKAYFGEQEVTFTYKNNSVMQQTPVWKHDITIDHEHLGDVYVVMREDETFLHVDALQNDRAQSLVSEVQTLEQNLTSTEISFNTGVTVFDSNQSNVLYSLLRWKSEEGHYSCNKITTGAQLKEDREEAKKLIAYVPGIGQKVEFWYGKMQDAIDRGILHDFSDETDYVILEEENPTAPSTIISLDVFKKHFGQDAYNKAMEQCQDEREQVSAFDIHEDYRGGKDVDTSIFQAQGYEGDYHTSSEGLVFADRVGRYFRTKERLSTQEDWEFEARVSLDQGSFFNLTFEDYNGAIVGRTGLRVAHYNDSREGKFDVFYGSQGCARGNRLFDFDQDSFNIKVTKRDDEIEFYVNNELVGLSDSSCLPQEAFFVFGAQGPEGDFNNTPEMQVEGTPEVTLETLSLKYL